MQTNIEHYDYELPETSIAQTPAQPRDSARLLDASTKTLVHRYVGNLATLVGPGDIIVVNNTRVLQARLHLQKETGGTVEVFLLEPANLVDLTQAGIESTEETKEKYWRALVKPSRRVANGTLLYPSTQTTQNDTKPEHCETKDVEVKDAEEAVLCVSADLGEGIRLVETVKAQETHLELAQRLGQVPLPPYIHTELENPERYQTVYSNRISSVAAPTAGLHLTEELLNQCRQAGAQIATVELTVGLATFRPIVSNDITQHHMHGEQYAVSQETVNAIEKADRVIAVGTTTVRALESAAATGQLSGTTELYITPGYDFQYVDLLWTNFHQPRSSLLVLLAAFAGPRWKEIYEQAIRHNYRFLSFGDAMLVARHDALISPKH